MAYILQENTEFIRKCVEDKKSYREIANTVQQQYNVRGLSAASVKKFVLEFGLRKLLSKNELVREVGQATKEVSRSYVK